MKLNAFCHLEGGGCPNYSQSVRNVFTVKILEK